MLTLTALNGQDKGRAFQLTGEKPELVGRQAQVIKLTDAQTSRKHAEVLLQNNTWLIRDLGSTNGTWVNGQKISHITELEAGDRIVMGRHQFRVTSIDALPSPTPQPKAPAPEPMIGNEELADMGVDLSESLSADILEEDGDLPEVTDDALVDLDDELGGDQAPDKPAAKAPPPTQAAEDDGIIDLDALLGDDLPAAPDEPASEAIPELDDLPEPVTESPAEPPVEDVVDEAPPAEPETQPKPEAEPEIELTQAEPPPVEQPPLVEDVVAEAEVEAEPEPDIELPEAEPPTESALPDDVIDLDAILGDAPVSSEEPAVEETPDVEPTTEPPAPETPESPDSPDSPAADVDDGMIDKDAMVLEQATALPEIELPGAESVADDEPDQQPEETPEEPDVPDVPDVPEVAEDAAPPIVEEQPDEPEASEPVVTSDKVPLDEEEAVSPILSDDSLSEFMDELADDVVAPAKPGDEAMDEFDQLMEDSSAEASDQPPVVSVEVDEDDSDEDETPEAAGVAAAVEQFDDDDSQDTAGEITGDDQALLMSAEEQTEAVKGYRRSKLLTLVVLIVSIGAVAAGAYFGYDYFVKQSSKSSNPGTKPALPKADPEVTQADEQPTETVEPEPAVPADPQPVDDHASADSDTMKPPPAEPEPDPVLPDEDTEVAVADTTTNTDAPALTEGDVPSLHQPYHDVKPAEADPPIADPFEDVQTATIEPGVATPVIESPTDTPDAPDVPDTVVVTEVPDTPLAMATDDSADEVIAESPTIDSAEPVVPTEPNEPAATAKVGESSDDVTGDAEEDLALLDQAVEASRQADDQAAQFADARRLVYVVDASGSLVDSFPYVLRELDLAITDLPDGDAFTVVFFGADGVIEVPPAGLRWSNEANKQQMSDWLVPDKGNVTAWGRGDVIQALQKAIGYQPTEMIILSDNLIGGRVTEQQAVDVLDKIGEMVGEDVEKIHVIQFFNRDQQQVLKRIAERFNGTYSLIINSPSSSAQTPTEDYLSIP